MATSKNGYYDPNIDYSLAIKNAQASGASQSQINRLQQERQNKINAQYGGTDPYRGSSNIMGSSGTSGRTTGTSSKPAGSSSLPSYSANSNVDYHQQAIDAASKGDWGGVRSALSARQEKINAQGGNDRGTSNQSIYQSLLAQYGTPAGGTPSRDEDIARLYAGQFVGDQRLYLGQGWSNETDYLAEALAAARRGDLDAAYQALERRGYKLADTGSTGGGTSQAQAYQMVQQAYGQSGALEQAYDSLLQRNQKYLDLVARPYDDTAQPANAYKTTQRRGSDGKMYYVTFDGNGIPFLVNRVGTEEGERAPQYSPEEIDAMADYYRNGFSLDDYYRLHNFAVDRTGVGRKYDENGILQLEDEDVAPQSLIPQLQALGINPILNSQLGSPSQAGMVQPPVQPTGQSQMPAYNYPALSTSDLNAMILGQLGLTGGMPGGTVGGYNFGAAPEYTPMYDSEISAMIDQLLSSSFDDFRQSDDYENLYGQYSENGQRAMQDVMGQLAANTGGYASSYAAAAAGQAYNDYMTTLEDAARSMYQDQLNQQLQNLGVLTDAENTNYNQYLNELSQWNTDRDFSYNQYLNDLNMLYQMGRDQVEDQRYQDENAYNQALLQAETLAGYGDFSGYKALGYSDAQIQQMQRAYQSQVAASRSSGGSKSSSSSSSSKPRLTAAQTLDALENGLRNQSVLDAYEYYYGEPFADGSRSGTEAGSSGGMNPDYYRAFGNSIMAQLNAGKEDAVISNIDARWDELSAEQQRGVQNILASYGLQYSPN